MINSIQTLPERMKGGTISQFILLAQYYPHTKIRQEFICKMMVFLTIKYYLANKEKISCLYICNFFLRTLFPLKEVGPEYIMYNFIYTIREMHYDSTYTIIENEH